MSRSFASSSSLRGASARPSGRSGASGLSRSSSTAGAGASGDAATSAGANASAQRRNADLSYANLESDDDFERLLASYDVPLVVDVLRRYLAMEVQSSLTGASSKQNSAQIKRQFYERFNQILDRLFGNDDVSKHKYGGWLDYSVGLAPAVAQRKKKLQSLGSLSPAQEEELRMESYVDSLTSGGRALTEFLGFIKDDEAGSMFQLLFKMTHPVEFKLELDLLPEQSKLSLLSRSAFTSVLFTQLLQKPITKQRMDPRNPVLLVSIKELYLFYFMRHPACANHQASPSDAAAPPTIMDSISDTFARPKRKETYSWRAFFTEGVASLTRGNPYNVLLLQYLKLFFPDASKPVPSRFHGKLLQHSNLFLHILIEFWLRQNLIVFSDDAAPPVDWSGYRTPQKLASPLATVLTQTAYMAPSDDLLSSLLLTIIHLLSDSFYPAPLEVATGSSSAPVSASVPGMVVGSGGGYLSPSISVLRRPLYELFRLVFSRAPIGLSPTAFLAIADVWLAFIQPWNCQQWAKGQAPASSTGLRRAASDTGSPSAEPGSSSPSSASPSSPSSSSSSYTPAWETFVLANYHFYTTLLGAFIERAKELDFTGTDERSLVVLDRVLSVFNPELLSLLRHASDFLDKHQPYSINASSSYSSSLLQISTKSSKSKINASDRSDGLSPLQGQVLTYHCKALGIECIGVPLHATYHRDAERVFDKLWSDSGVSAGGGADTKPSSSGESPFERVHRLSRQLRRVFEISDAYVASTAHARSLPSANGLEPMEPSRHSRLRHLLTLEGIRQLRRGERLCSPEELSYIGDPMLRPIGSCEIGLLVRLSYRVSTWLNAQCGLENPYKGKYFEDNTMVDPETSFTAFRFNLRFLASKPNLAFLTGLFWLVYLLLLW
jgi:hypothetical protein